MKNKNFFLFGIALIAVLLFPIVGFAQECPNQKINGWYIETIKFKPYAKMGMQHRRDTLDREIMRFISFHDSSLLICIYDYDNIKSKSRKREALSLVKDLKIPFRYNCEKCLYTPEEFTAIIEKILDRLDEK